MLALLYLKAHRREPGTRPLARRYAIGFVVVAVFWLASTFVPDTYRPLLWLAAVGTDVYVVLSRKTRRLYPLLPLDVPRLSERFGQFTLIVLGESFIKIVDALSDAGIPLATNLYGAVAFIFIAALWWTYFQDVAGSVIREGASLTWAFLHIPLMLGVTALGVALRDVVLLDTEEGFDIPHRILLHGSVALCFASIAAMDLLREEGSVTRRRKIIARLVAAAIFILLATLGLRLHPTLGLGAAVAVCLAQIALEIQYAPSSVHARAVPAEGAGSEDGKKGGDGRGRRHRDGRR